ncbi:aromatic hydrocarbon degradation protein [Azorhizobium oxalatiphilum]|uniref:Aromatic hydrocarbon degradation protein n=1 Tax=Azorhizobium oxalatiphilum TaxID=980631 RepID=A0A917C320_9HYPH|nr:aromatic hydrocarbon degradation protein [Azorhizobium oxalatiphilum]
MLALGASSALAGGFGLREQGAYYQGSSFAGVAAGGAGLASMYWNPAATSMLPGMQVEANVSYVMPHASVDVNSATAPLTGANLGRIGVGDIVDDAALPASYVSYGWDRIAVGLALNAPFGLVTDAPCNWSGRYYGCYSRIYDVNVQGSLAYKVNDWLTIGGGVSLNYMDARLTQAQIIGVGLSGPITGSGAVDGDDVGLGFSLGALFTLAPGTTVGIGYRSFVDLNLDGQVTAYTPFGTPAAMFPAHAGLTLPDQVTGSFRSQLNPQWTVMGTVEWTNWSTVQQLIVLPTGTSPSVLDLKWRDGWFFSGGVEYQWDPRLALRAGLGYEISPVTDEVRTPRLPDSNRTWLSVGATYQWTPQLSFDLAYTHIFGDSGTMNLSPLDPANATRGTLTAEVNNAYVDIVSLGVRYRFDAPQPTQTALIVK